MYLSELTTGAIGSLLIIAFILGAFSNEAKTLSISNGIVYIEFYKIRVFLYGLLRLH